MSSNGYSLGCKSLYRNSSRRSKTGGYSAREMSAAAEVLIAVIFDVCGKISVSGTRLISKFAIILTSGILIFYYKGYRRSGSSAVENAAHDLHLVSLLTSRRDLADRSSQGHLPRDKLLIDRDPRSKTVKHRTYCSTVAFAENRDCNT